MSAIGTHSLPLVLAAVIGIVALVVGVVIGTVPAAGAIGVALLIPAAVIDIEQRRLPDAWVITAMAGLATTLAVGSAVGRANGGDVGLVDVAGGAIAMAVPVLVLHLVSPASMGFGDVKAAIVLGAAVGTVDGRLGVVALCLAAALGATVGLVTRRRTIPFGPFLVAGAWIALLAHGPLAEALFTAGAPS